jgi:methionyl-tRNA formyltransferase
VTSLRIAFAGTPEFALPALQALAGSSHQLTGVFTQPDRPRGRGQRVTASPVKQAAEALGLTVLQPESFRTDAARLQLAALNPDAFVVVAYGQILPQAVLELPRFGCINIHASLLPRWRGAAPIQRAILAGDLETGVSIMRMNAGLDTGPILWQERVPIGAADTAGSLHDRLAQLGASALLATLASLAQRELEERPQTSEGALYAPKLSKAEAIIDWAKSTAEIERLVRAFNPWPVAETRFEGEPLRILAAHAVPGSGSEIHTAPGSVVGVREGVITVTCGIGRLAITQLQRPGRRPTSASDFAHSCELMGRRFG